MSTQQVVCITHLCHWLTPPAWLLVPLISCSAAVCCLTGPRVRGWGWAGGRKQVCASERVVRGIVSRVSLSQMLTWEHCPVPALESASVNHKHSQNDNNSHMTQAHGEIPMYISYILNINLRLVCYLVSQLFYRCSPVIPGDTATGHGTLLQIFRDQNNTEYYLCRPCHVISNHVLSANQVKTLTVDWYCLLSVWIVYTGWEPGNCLQIYMGYIHFK